MFPISTKNMKITILDYYSNKIYFLQFKKFNTKYVPKENKLKEANKKIKLPQTASYIMYKAILAHKITIFHFICIKIFNEYGFLILFLPNYTFCSKTIFLLRSLRFSNLQNDFILL